MKINILSIDNSSDFIISYKGRNYQISPDRKLYELIRQIKYLQKEAQKCNSSKN